MQRLRNIYTRIQYYTLINGVDIIASRNEFKTHDSKSEDSITGVHTNQLKEVGMVWKLQFLQDVEMKN